MLDLTLGIPIYNSSRTLGETIESIARQKVQPHEILLLDDHSNDNSLSLARNLVSDFQLKNVRFMENECNLGIASSYNSLANAASSGWIQILDADDALDREFLSKVADMLGSPAANTIITAMTINSTSANFITQTFSRVIPKRPPLILPMLGTLATRSGVIYRTESLRKTPFPSPQYDGSDIIHLLHLRLKGNSLFCRDARVHYRLHDMATSNKASLDSYLEALKEFPKLRPFYLLDLWLRKTLFGSIRNQRTFIIC